VKPLGVIPAYVRDEGDVTMLTDTIASVIQTAGEDLDLLVVDDGSPAGELVDAVALEAVRLGFELVRKAENEGFSRTVNVGLKRALDEGRDAILINADMQMVAPGWVAGFVDTAGLVTDGPASVVGALLLYPNGLIQHAGIYFSLLTRTFDHLYKYGPHDLPEAQLASLRPVTGALQFIRYETLADIGLYDEGFRMGFEDVDYCLRVMLSGREAVYQPKVRAFHLESMFRSRRTERLTRWQNESFMRLMRKYSEQSFAGLVPTL
jgi:GT2 family glycosyltransferase